MNETNLQIQTDFYMKQIYKTLILTLFSLWSVASSAQNQVTYGFIQDPNNPLIITAVAYPNFTSNNVTIATGLFSFLLPAGTVTDPNIPPAPASGSFIDVTGDWTAQLVNAANYSSVPGNDPNDLMGFDVYQVVLQNSPSPNTVSGQPIQLFRFTLTNDCMGDSVRVLVNDSAIQMAILNNLGANFNNEMSISVDNTLSVDLYVGNAPVGDILPCPLDDVPDAVNDTISVNEDSGPTNILVVANDVFGNNGPAAEPVDLVTPAVNGTTMLNENGTPNDPTDDFLTYTPNANFFGQDSIFYAICDANGDCDTAMVVITVNAINDAPIAVDDNYPINEDAPLSGDVTDNDTDVDGPMVLITLVTNVANGMLTLNGDGTFSYTPNANFTGSDSFVYSYCDGGTPNLCDTATVTIPVNAANDPPIAVNDNYPVNEDAPLSGDVTDNDTDVDGPMMLITLVTNVANGMLTLNGDGTFSYTPNANFNGSDSFTYSYCDGGTPNLCDTATVTIPVNAVNDAPVANNDSYPINEDAPLSGDVTDNDTDVDGPMVLITLVTNVANGMLTLNGDGTFSYTPNANFNGSDSFVYSYCDGGTPNLCDTATVTIPVGAVNDAPIANNDSYPINEDAPLSGDVTDNDTDVDGPMVLITLVTDVANGTLTLNPDGTFSYTPDPNFNGSDTFTYSYCDGGTPNQCDTATVTIPINAVNDAPVAVNDSYNVNEGNTLMNNVTGNDTDPDGPMVLITLVTNVTNGMLTLNGNGSFSYTPNANFNGSDSFVYSYCDGGTPNLCDTATVTIAVDAINDAPIANNDNYPINEDAPLSGDVTDNDTDVDGPMVLITLVTDVTNGTLTLNPDGTFSYTPDPNFNGSDSFTYSYCDGGTPNQCDTATVTIPVAAVNDGPVAVNDNYPINEDAPLSGDVTDNDTDVDGPIVLVTLVTDVANGTLTLNGDGTFSYTPDPNFNGSDNFVYSYCDGGTPNLCDTATVNIPVAPANDAPVANNDTYPLTEDGILMGDVTDNDTDTDGPMTNVTVVTSPTNGMVIINPDGTFTYTPNGNFNGF